MIISSKFNNQPTLIYMWLWSSNQHDKIDWLSHWFGRKTRRNMLKVPLNKMKSMHLNMYAFTKVIGDDHFFFWGSIYHIYIGLMKTLYSCMDSFVWTFCKGKLPLFIPIQFMWFSKFEYFELSLFLPRPPNVQKGCLFQIGHPYLISYLQIDKCLAILDIDSKESKYPMGVFQVYILLGVSDQLCHKYIIV
jgi:hypothetical protein